VGTPIREGSPQTLNGDELITYRLAVAATGEYTAYHGGTVAAGQAAIVTAINRVNAIYETELAIRLELVANNSSIVYTDPNFDPYTEYNQPTQNQTNLDNVIGSANYDIGHVFHTSSYSTASLGSVCSVSDKAQGLSSLSAPINDPFWIDKVAHQIGHQFGAHHTANSSSCRDYPATAYEPGSGTTILGQTTQCGGDSLQSNNDPYFHTISFDEIVAFITSGSGSSCGTHTATGNTPPTNINANANSANGVYIPVNTPFELTGSATDPDGDTLTYTWEQFDLGPSGPLGMPMGNAPIFRSRPPTSSPTRTFPPLSYLANNTTPPVGDALPTYSRDLTFRFTVRDNRAGGGGVGYDTVSFNVTETSSPFAVTSPNTNIAWTGTFTETVTWDVAGTNDFPIDCQAVNITLSTDGGYTYPITVLANTPNDGSQDIRVPNVQTITARIRVECANNIFFDISNQNFTIYQNLFEMAVTPTSRTICEGSSTSYNISISSYGMPFPPVHLEASGAPITPSFSYNDYSPYYESTMTFTNPPRGYHTFDLVGTGGELTNTVPIALNVDPNPMDLTTLLTPVNASTNVSITPNFSWSAVLGAQSYDIDIATDPGFINIVHSANVTTNSYNGATLNGNTTYYWRVRANGNCAVSDYVSASFTTESSACMNILLNGDFEAGRVDWAESAVSSGHDLIIQSAAANNSDWHAWLGGYNNETDTLSQDITLAAGATVTLTYLYDIFNTDNCGADFATVNLDSNNIFTHNLCPASETGGYVAANYDLSNYADGLPHTLNFVVNTNNSTPSNIHLDDILLTVCDTCNTPAPTLLTPPDATIDVWANPDLSWTAVPGATNYDIDIATDSGFTNIVDSATVTTTSYNGAYLDGSTTYYWRVRAIDGCVSDYTYASFTTIALVCVDTILNGGFESGPVDWVVTETPFDYDIIGQWSAANSGDWSAYLGGQDNNTDSIAQDIFLPADSIVTLNYSYYLNSVDFCGYDFGAAKLDNNFIAAYALCNGTATDDFVPATYNLSSYADSLTHTLNFTISTDNLFYSLMLIDDVSVSVCNTCNLPPTTLLTPANMTTDVPITPTFSWTPISGATSYDIDIATDPDFNYIIDSANVITTSYTSPTLGPGATYYWRVRPVNSCLSSYTYGSFTTSTANASCVDILLNGDFESGNVNWVETSSSGGNIIGQWGASYDGVWSAWLGNHNGQASKAVYQDVTLPAGAGVTLAYYYAIVSSQNCGSGHFAVGEVNLDNNILADYRLCQVNATNYLQASYNLSNYADDLTHTLNISTTNETSETGYFHLDAATLTVCTPTAPCITPDPLTTLNINTIGGGNIQLDWSPAPNADEYEVWYSTTAPYLDPTSLNCASPAPHTCTTQTTTDYTAAHANGTLNYYYTVLARNVCGDTSPLPTTNTHRGTFNYALIPGT
ncbi:MAG TPA: zinc-dependent metalloprotease family protein, partial [Anaerolineae bacterium]|nr:zinc-dependent metalloprotease family protein [Anaerolineae bacterium]